MRPSSLFWRVFVFLVYPAIISTVALYLYPAVLSCSFPLATKPTTQCMFDGDASTAPAAAGKVAPFRLLALGDPQLEGDTSLPRPEELSFPSIRRLLSARDKRAIVRQSAKDFFSRDIPATFHYYRKLLDLFGNDYYLAHIYRTLHWWTSPTHVAVVGDLLGSQWIGDDEFSRRSWRYWNRVFRHGRRVEDAITADSAHTEVLGADETWSRRIINVAGNHDIGYAGDINRHRLDRFERDFGPVNWDVNFQLARPTDGASLVSSSAPASLRLVVLNDMNLDGPAQDDAAQLETYQYMNDLISKRLNPVEDRKSAVILLTHIPLFKVDGVCVDGPYTTYRDTGVKEQNHLSQSASAGILGGIFGKSDKYGAAAKGLGRQGIIVNGHDHEGCDVYHHTSPPPQTPPESGADAIKMIDTQRDFKWHAQRWTNASTFVGAAEVPGIREITLRSMMGSYGGFAGLLSAWYDEDEGQWHFEQAYCPLGVQYVWWTVHIVDLVTLGLLIAAGAAYAVETRQVGQVTRPNTNLRQLDSTQQPDSKLQDSAADSPLANSSGIAAMDTLKTPRQGRVRKKKSATGSLRAVTPSDDGNHTGRSKRGSGGPRKAKRI